MAGHGVADWMALPDGLIKKIDDIYLSTDDLNYYAVFRSVCGAWHRAMPPEHFKLSKWIIFEHSMSKDALVDEAAATLLNVSTGRFVEKKIPRVIRRYFYVCTSGGLIVLGQRVPPYKTRVFYPLTGAMKRLKVKILAEQVSALVMTMSSSLRVFVTNLQNHTVRWTDESSEAGPSALGFGEELYRVADVFGVLRSMTHFVGDMFVTDKHAIISTMISNAEEGIIVEMNTTIAVLVLASQNPENLFYIVESGGELLFVVSGRVYDGDPVYRVDTKNRILEPVRNIGSHTLFVGMNRCISVDSSKVHTMQASSVYYADLSEIRSYDYKAHAWEKEPKVVAGYGVGGLWHNEQPFALDELLAEYCRTVEYSELQMVPPYGEDSCTYYVYYDGYASD